MSERATMPPPAVAPAAWQSCSGRFPGRPDQVGEARAFVARFLHGHTAADEAILLVSELCANAVAHSASGRPGGTFTVRAEIEGPVVRAEVEDQGSGWDGNLRAAQCPHGLFLLRQFSAACGAVPRGPGWLIWFTLA